MTRYLLDSSCWVAYLDGGTVGEAVQAIIRTEECATCVLSLAEVGALLDNKGMGVAQRLQHMKNTTTIIGVDADIAAASGPFRNEQRKRHPKFSTADAVLYLTAQKTNLILLTRDMDFEGLPGVRLLA